VSPVIEITLAVIAGLAISAVILSLGERMRRVSRLPCPIGVRPAVAFGLGSLGLGSAVLGAGLVGLMAPVPLMVLLGAGAALGDWRAVRGLLMRMRVAAGAAIPLMAVAVAPPFFYDSWVYHLGLPWQALQAGAIRAHESNLFSTFPPLAQLVYAIPLSVDIHRATGVIHLVGFVAGATAITALAQRLGATRLPAALAGICVLYLPTSPLVPAFPAAEAWSIVGVSAAVALAIGARPLSGAALGAGLLGGIACASRLQGVPWAALVGVILILRAPRQAPRALALQSFGLIIGSIPWWSKNLILLGSPAAPIGMEREGIDTLWRDASSHLKLAADFPDLLSRVSGSLGSMAVILAPLVLASLVGLVLRRRSANLIVVMVAVGGLAVWSLTGALPRFLLPSVALLGASAAALGRGRGRTLISTSILGAVVVWGSWAAWNSFGRIGGLSMLGSSESVYASTVISNPYATFSACEELPDDARLLLVSEPRGYRLPRRFESSSQHDRSVLTTVLEEHASPEAAAEALGRMGFTHLLINVREMHRLGDRYPVLPWRDDAGRARFVAFTQRLGTATLLNDDVMVYSLSEVPEENLWNSLVR
jgi:hypothetical protein